MIGPIGATSPSNLSLPLVKIVFWVLDPTPSSYLDYLDPFGRSRLHPAGMSGPMAPERDPVGQRRVSRQSFGRHGDGTGGASSRLDPEIWYLPDSSARTTSVAGASEPPNGRLSPCSGQPGGQRRGQASLHYATGKTRHDGATGTLTS
jgi:hypothetical protein